MRPVAALLLIALIPIATLPGCATNNDDASTPGAQPIAAFTPVGSWTLTRIDGERYDLPDGARTPTLTIAPGGAISGQAGINRFSGKADPEAWATGDWQAGGIVMTRMGGEPQAMTFEQGYIAMLQRADGLAPGQRTMDLTVGDRELLRFTRAD